MNITITLADCPNVGVISSTGTFMSSLSSSQNDEIETPGDGTPGNSSENDERGEVFVVVLVTFCAGDAEESFASSEIKDGNISTLAAVKLQKQQIYHV